MRLNCCCGLSVFYNVVCVVCCLVFVICRALLVARCALRFACSVSFDAFCFLVFDNVCCVLLLRCSHFPNLGLFAVVCGLCFCVLLVASYLLRVDCALSFVVCCVLNVACCRLHVI